MDQAEELDGGVMRHQMIGLDNLSALEQSSLDTTFARTMDGFLSFKSILQEDIRGKTK